MLHHMTNTETATTMIQIKQKVNTRSQENSDVHGMENAEDKMNNRAKVRAKMDNPSRQRPSN